MLQDRVKLDQERLDLEVERATIGKMFVGTGKPKVVTVMWSMLQILLIVYFLTTAV